MDTNILVYSSDRNAGEKWAIAKNLLDELWQAHMGVLSVQVLQEFYVTVTRKIAIPLSKEAAREIVELYAPWCGETSASEVLSATRIEKESRITFWDALIVASAAKAGADRIASEDMNDGQVIAGVRIENPFLTTP